MLEISKFNVALLGKWIWQLGTDKKGLWKRGVGIEVRRLEKSEDSKD